MRHIIVLFVTLLSTNSATAQQQTTGNDSINHIIQLQEIVRLFMVIISLTIIEYSRSRFFFKISPQSYIKTSD